MNGEDIMEQLFREYFADILSNDNADNGFNIKIGELSREEFGVEFNIFVKILYVSNYCQYFSINLPNLLTLCQVCDIINNAL